jgi:hypothetical protein
MSKPSSSSPDLNPSESSQNSWAKLECREYIMHALYYATVHSSVNSQSRPQIQVKSLAKLCTPTSLRTQRHAASFVTTPFKSMDFNWADQIGLNNPATGNRLI